MDEQYKERFIPPNFENGVNIFGLNFKAVFLIEGGVLGVISFFLFFFAIKDLFGITDFGQTAGISIAFASVIAFFGIKGINDEPLTTFLFNLMLFAKGRRTAFYNPRVKEEAVSYTKEREELDPSAEAIPRERILALIDEMKEKRQGKAFIDESTFNPVSMQFEEDKILEEKKKQEERAEGKKK